MSEEERMETEEEQPEVMAEEGAAEVTPEVTPETASEEAAQQKAEAKKDKTPHSIKEALKQVESFGQALSEALQGRGNVVMARVNDEALDHLDMLVEAEITKSRSESAAFLINEGIAANQELFGKISTITNQISELRDRLRQEVKLQPKAENQE